MILHTFPEVTKKIHNIFQNTKCVEIINDRYKSMIYFLMEDNIIAIFNRDPIYVLYVNDELYKCFDLIYNSNDIQKILNDILEPYAYLCENFSISILKLSWLGVSKISELYDEQDFEYIDKNYKILNDDLNYILKYDNTHNKPYYVGRNGNGKDGNDFIRKEKYDKYDILPNFNSFVFNSKIISTININLNNISDIDIEKYYLIFLDGEILPLPNDIISDLQYINREYKLKQLI